MGHPVTKESAAAILFLALYTALAGWMYFCYATKRYTFKSRWTMLAFHTTVRVASQVRLADYTMDGETRLTHS